MRSSMWFRLLALGAVAAALALGGCASDGDDGSDGLNTLTLTTAEPAGDNCADGGQRIDSGLDTDRSGILDPEEVTSTSYVCNGEGIAAAAEVESCEVCHGSVGQEFDVQRVHALQDVAIAENVTQAIDEDTGDLVVSFDVLLDGVLNDDFELRRAYVHYDDPTLQTDPPTLVTTFVRETATNDVELVANGDGSYTATVLAADLTPDSTYLFQLEYSLDANDDGFPDSAERPVVVVTNGTSPERDLVADSGCEGCHGNPEDGLFPAWGKKFRHYAVGGSECGICHSQATRNTAFIYQDDAGAFVTSAPAIYGTNITEYIHGIHNSHNMPSNATYYRNTAPDDTANIEDRWSVGYPSDMRNCAVCHLPGTQLETVAAAPVSYYLCMTCHQNWDGFTHVHDDAENDPPDYLAGDPIFGSGDFHRGATPETNCMSCHGAITSIDEVADFHNDFIFDDHYDQFYRGEDISFANNNEVTFAVTGVTSDGSNVSFTWAASKLGAAVDPCNTDVAAGPTFQGLGAYLGYGKGDDWVNEFVGSSPGQPVGADDLFGELTTTCAANVATTTGLVLDPEALAYADRVLLAVGGKPVDQDTFVIGTAPTAIAYYVREPSPTYAFDPADGSALTARRDAVSNDKCLACHNGTLYQHGGDRVDNEQLCVICHNPASNEKNNRLDRFQIVNADGTVNTDATYDGKASETYDMRYMIHAIHGVDKRDDPIVIYRSRGIYGFAPALYEELYDPVEDEFSTIEVPYPLPTGWPADGQTIYGSTNDSTITHNWIVVHYPQPANKCDACHNAEGYKVPDQTKAVALTIDSGDDYPDQSDDTVIGPTAAACTACHSTTTTYRHATYDMGYEANVTKDEMLEKAAE